MVLINLQRKCLLVKAPLLSFLIVWVRTLLSQKYLLVLRLPPVLLVQKEGTLMVVWAVITLETQIQEKGREHYLHPDRLPMLQRNPGGGQLRIVVEMLWCIDVFVLFTASTQVCWRAVSMYGWQRVLRKSANQSEWLIYVRYSSRKVILVPRPTPFCSLVCIDNNTWKQKSGEKWGRPVKIHHVSDIEWTWGATARKFKHSWVSCLQHLESRLAVKHPNLAEWMMNWLRTGWINYRPCSPYIHLVSTWHQSYSLVCYVQPIFEIVTSRYYRVSSKPALPTWQERKTSLQALDLWTMAINHQVEGLEIQFQLFSPE